MNGMTAMTISAENARQDALVAVRESMLTPKEFAFVMKIDVLSVYRRIRQRKIAGVVRFGREIRIDISLALQHE